MYSKNIKTQIFNPEGVVKLAYFQKKWSIPLSRYTCDSKVIYCTF